MRKISSKKRLEHSAKPGEILGHIQSISQFSEGLPENSYRAVTSHLLDIKRLVELLEVKAKAQPSARSQRWRNSASRAEEALNLLAETQEEYQEWRDNLPENLEDSATAEKLDEVLEIDLQEAIEIVQQAQDVELPIGFGRD